MPYVNTVKSNRDQPVQRRSGDTLELADMRFGVQRDLYIEGPLDDQTIERLAMAEHRGTLIRQVGGLMLVLLGTVLALAGVTGNVEWVIQASRLTNASPGVVSIAAGTLVLLRVRPRIRIKRYAAAAPRRQRQRASQEGKQRGR